VRRAVTKPDIARQFAGMGMEAEPCTPQELTQLLQEQMDLVGKLAQAAGISPQ
jgi:hypothetical protein